MGKKKILIIDDDEFYARVLMHELGEEEFDITVIDNAKDALSFGQEKHFDIVISDMMMESEGTFKLDETAGGLKTGMLICKEIREYLPDALFIAFTNNTDPEIETWFSQDDRYFYALKGNVNAYELRKIIKLKHADLNYTPNVFIVHGHDYSLALELKEYIQNKLNFEEPTILSEKPSQGMTVIEKLEYYAKELDIVFAIFTPDDNLVSGIKQARPNVLFEYGYFLGKLGRKTGKVIMLYKDGTNIPTDLNGVVYINVSEGIMEADTEIRNELKIYLCSS